MTPPKYSVDSDGRLHGANVTWNDPWPTPNGSPGGMVVPSGVNGVVMHTMVGNSPGTISEFNNPGAQASAHFAIDQDGNVHQFGPVNGWMSWAQENGNPTWYSIEHADNGDPGNPLTQAQMNASAQVVEALSRVGNFPLQVTDSTGGEGYGVHNMGGAAWGGHSCPQNPNGSGPRAGQRTQILQIAKAIRTGAPVSQFPMTSGDEGTDVLTLQQMLNKWAKLIKLPKVLDEDSDFGPDTAAATLLAQEYFGQRGSTPGIIVGGVNQALWNDLKANPAPPVPVKPSPPVKPSYGQPQKLGVSADAEVTVNWSAPAPVAGLTAITGYAVYLRDGKTRALLPGFPKVLLPTVTSLTLSLPRGQGFIFAVAAQAAGVTGAFAEGPFTV